jgi:GH35 family endo-1,4-beta-xylanase
MMRLTALLACALLAAGAPFAHAAASDTASSTAGNTASATAGTAASDAAKAHTTSATKRKAAKPNAEEGSTARRKSRREWESMTPEERAEAKKRYAANRPEGAKAKAEAKEKKATPAADLPPPSAGPR